MRRPIVWLLLISACAKLLYVLLLTDYSQYLFSDFLGYWERAVARAQGEEFDINQWAVWPPLPHIFLSWYLRAVDLVGLSTWRLQAVIVANVLFSTGSVAALYGIGLALLKDRRYALAVAAVYAFTFPLVYFNAFVMSEHPAVFFFLTAIWLALRFRRNLWGVAATGIVLGITVSLRPAFGPYGLAFALYIAFADWFDRRALMRAALFSLGFFLVVTAVVAENHRISGGKLTGLGANGGINFYFAQCHTHAVSAESEEFSGVLIPPQTVDTPENGSIRVARPFYDQAFYARLGWECFQRQPLIWLANLQNFRSLFFGPLLPSVNSAWGFWELLVPFQWFFLFCAALAPLALFVRVPAEQRAGIDLLLGLIATSFVTFYVFTSEHRYLYPLLGPFYVVGAGVIGVLAERRRRVMMTTAGWAVLTVAIGLTVIVFKSLDGPSAAVVIDVVVRQSPVPLTRLPPADAGAPINSFTVNSLRFPESDRLRHYRRGDLGAYENVGIVFDTCMNVTRQGTFEFQVVSDDGIALELDGRNVVEYPEQRSYEELSRVFLPLDPGLHHYRLRYFQAQGNMGVSATWRRLDAKTNVLMPALGLHYIGRTGDGVNFQPASMCPVAAAKQAAPAKH